jgi:hypothetical protein
MTACNEDARVAEVATEAADRQAEQNKEMAQLNREVAEGTKRLVEADGNAREAFVSLQRDLQTEQAEVGQQRDQLEEERRAIAGERLRESILAPIIANAGPLVVCGLALVLCWFLLFGLRRDGDDNAVVGEILIEELIAERPALLPPAASLQALEGREPMPAVIADQTGADAEDANEE